MIASIHQPSTLTFSIFDRLLVLSNGKMVYNGAVANVQPYFDSLGFKMPLYTNPAEYVIDLVNTDFTRDRAKADGQLASIQNAWSKSANAEAIVREIGAEAATNAAVDITSEKPKLVSSLGVPLTLIHRNFIKSYRDVVAYGIRIAMYMGLAIMMGTVWLRLSTEQKNIQSFINAIVRPTCFL